MKLYEAIKSKDPPDFPKAKVPFCVPQPNQRNDHAVPERLSIQHDDSQRIGIVDIVKATQKLEEHSRCRFTLVVEKNKRRIHHCKMDGK